MSGNTLGARRWYEYTADGGQKYKYLTDQNLGEAVGAVLNDQLPGFPSRFKPRMVYCEADIDGVYTRKRVICPLTTTPAYAAINSTTITIDEEEFKTTGRRGEKASFGSNPTEEAGTGGTGAAGGAG